MSLRTDRKQVFSRDRMTYRMPAYIRFLPSEDAGISSDCGWNSDYFFVQKLRKFVQKILKRPDVFQQPFPFLSYSNAESSFSKRKAHRKLP